MYFSVCFASLLAAQMGPFVDADHPMIKSGGDIFVEQDDAPPVPITYDQIWADLGAC